MTTTNIDFSLPYSVELQAEQDLSTLLSQKLEAETALSARLALKVASITSELATQAEAAQAAARLWRSGCEDLQRARAERDAALVDAEHWRNRKAAEKLIEDEMPQGYAVDLHCSPGDWGMGFTDPAGQRIDVPDWDNVEGFIRAAVRIAKARIASTAVAATPVVATHPTADITE